MNIPLYRADDRPPAVAAVQTDELVVHHLRDDIFAAVERATLHSDAHTDAPAVEAWNVVLEVALSEFVRLTGTAAPNGLHHINAEVALDDEGRPRSVMLNWSEACALA